MVAVPHLGPDTLERMRIGRAATPREREIIVVAIISAAATKNGVVVEGQ